MSNPTKKIYLDRLFIGVFVSGLVLVFHKVFPEQKHSPNPIPPKSTEFSRAEYGRLNTETGMPLEAVEAILGRGTEINKTFKTSTYIWKQADGSEITAVFESGKLKSKAQQGLK
jgi:hypothetical protein